jgi:hypothetical protein
MSTAWEKRFPALGPGSTSVAIPRSTTPVPESLRPNSGQPGFRAATPGPVVPRRAATEQREILQGIIQGRVRPPSRGEVLKPPGPGGAIRAPTPQEALEAAVQAQRALLDFTSAGITPGQPSAGPKGKNIGHEKAVRIEASTLSNNQQSRSPSPGARSNSPVKHLLNHSATTLNATTNLNTTAPTPTTLFGREAATGEGEALGTAGDDSNMSGVERMELTMERVHRRYSQVPLDTRWKLLARWIDKFFVDKDLDAIVKACREVHTVATQKYSPPLIQYPTAGGTSGVASPLLGVTMAAFNSTFSATVAGAMANRGGYPNGVKIATSMMLLEQTLHMIARQHPPLYQLMSDIRDDVMKAVYYNPPGDGEDLNASFEVLTNSANVEQQRRLILRYYTKTYFQQLRDERKARKQNTEELEAKAQARLNHSKVLNRAVSYWQNHTVGNLFRAWRAEAARARAERATLQNIQDLEALLALKESELKARETELKDQMISWDDFQFKQRKEVKSLKSQLEESKRETEKWKSKYEQLRATLTRSGTATTIPVAVPVHRGGGAGGAGGGDVSDMTIRGVVVVSSDGHQGASLVSESETVDLFRQELEKLTNQLADANAEIQHLKQDMARQQQLLKKLPKLFATPALTLPAAVPSPSDRKASRAFMLSDDEAQAQKKEVLASVPYHQQLIQHFEQALFKAQVLPVHFFFSSTSQPTETVRAHVLLYAALLQVKTAGGVAFSPAMTWQQVEGIQLSTIAADVLKALQRIGVKEIFTSAADLTQGLNIAESTGKTAGAGGAQVDLGLTLDTATLGEVIGEAFEKQRRKHFAVLWFLYRYRTAVLPWLVAHFPEPSNAGLQGMGSPSSGSPTAAAGRQIRIDAPELSLSDLTPDLNLTVTEKSLERLAEAWRLCESRFLKELVSTV